jgi:hypothetical protein
MFPIGGVSERSKRMVQLALDQFDESDDDYGSDDSYTPKEDHLELLRMGAVTPETCRV